MFEKKNTHRSIRPGQLICNARIGGVVPECGAEEKESAMCGRRQVYYCN